MIVYFSTLAVVGMLLIAYYNRRLPQSARKFCYFLITATLLAVAGFRYYVGTDYAQYAYNYSTRYLLEGYSFLSQSALGIVAQFSRLIYDDYATWFFIMSAVTILPVMKTISRESVCVWLSVIMYILLCCWHVSFNLVKQGAAATILFAGYPLLRDRKFVKWCVMCLLASMFHVTALLMIPVFFLVNAQISWKRTGLILLIGAVVFASYDLLYDIADVLKQGESIVNRESEIMNTGVNILRIAVHCVPVLVYAFFQKRYRCDDDLCCLFNVSLLNAVLNVGSMNSIYLNRFCTYTNIFNVLFIPMLFQPIKRKRDTFWILPLALIFYFVFWSYDLYKGSDTVNFYWIFER